MSLAGIIRLSYSRVGASRSPVCLTPLRKRRLLLYCTPSFSVLLPFCPVVQVVAVDMRLSISNTVFVFIGAFCAVHAALVPPKSDMALKSNKTQSNYKSTLLQRQASTNLHFFTRFHFALQLSRFLPTETNRKVVPRLSNKIHSKQSLVMGAFWVDLAAEVPQLCPKRSLHATRDFAAFFVSGIGPLQI